MKHEGERARTALKVLETMTYSCLNPDDLCELASSVENLVSEFKKKLPNSEGIILRPHIKQAVRKRAQQILRKYRSLPNHVKRGKQKADWRHCHRVGQKASEIRKVNHPDESVISNCSFFM